MILGVLESKRQVKVCLMVSFQNLFFCDHLRLRECILCLILLFSPLEEVYGKLGFDVWWRGIQIGTRHGFYMIKVRMLRLNGLISLSFLTKNSFWHYVLNMCFEGNVEVWFWAWNGVLVCKKRMIGLNGMFMLWFHYWFKYGFFMIK